MDDLEYELSSIISTYAAEHGVVLESVTLDAVSQDSLFVVNAPSYLIKVRYAAQ